MPAAAPTLWVFAYGSLLWRPGFPHRERRTARLAGWTRRFWQGSPDHRGVPAAPGRVVTLVPDPDATCVGLAYALESEAAAVLAALDGREQGGYERRRVRIVLDGDAPVPAANAPRRGAVASRDASTAAAEAVAAEAVAWIAGPTNPHYLGPAPLDAIAAQVRTAHGPSGTNTDYVHALVAALRKLGVFDPHVESLATLLPRA